MSGFKSALIAGASGFVGSRIANVFLNTPGWTVHILASATSQEGEKKKAAFDKFIAQGAKIITGEVSKPETYENQIKGIDVVFCSLSAGQIQDQISLATVSKKAGVKLFVPSEYGWDLDQAHFDHAMFIGKREVRSAIEKLGLNHLYIVTGPFYEHLYAWPAWGIDVQGKKATQVGERSTKVTTVSITEAVTIFPELVNDPTLINKSAILGRTFTTGEIFDYAVAAIGKDVQTSTRTAEDISKSIKTAEAAGNMPYADVILYGIASGQGESPNHIDGSKYGKTFTHLKDWVPKFVPKVADGSFSLRH